MAGHRGQPGSKSFFKVTSFFFLRSTLTLAVSVQVSADGNIVTSRRSARRPGAAGALGRLAHAGAGPHAAGLGSHARHAPQPQLVPST